MSPKPLLGWLGLLALLTFCLDAAAAASGISLSADRTLELAFHAQSNNPLALAMRAFTWFGEVAVVAAITLIAAAVLLAARRWWLAVLLLLIMAGEAFLEQLLKHLFHRARPDLFPHVALSSFSFPSGHAMGTMCLLGALLLLARPFFPRSVWRVWVVIAGALLLGVGASRVYLGEHYPTDVLGGWFAGLAWLAAAVWSWQRIGLFRLHVRQP